MPQSKTSGIGYHLGSGVNAPLDFALDQGFGIGSTLVSEHCRPISDSGFHYELCPCLVVQVVFRVIHSSGVCPSAPFDKDLA